MMYIFISLGSPPITSRGRRGGRGREFRGRGRGFEDDEDTPGQVEDHGMVEEEAKFP